MITTFINADLELNIICAIFLASKSLFLFMKTALDLSSKR